MRGVQPTLRIRNLGNVHGSFTRDRFNYVPEHDVFICPEGKEMRHFTDNFQQRQAIYKPRRGTCKGCPLKAQCAPGQGDRAVIRRWDVEIWEQVEQRLASRHGRALLRRRQIVSERIFADAKVKHGLDRAQFRGRAKMQIQALLTAATMNVKRLIRQKPVPQSGVGVRSAVLPPESMLPSALSASVAWARGIARRIQRPIRTSIAFDHLEALLPTS